MSSPWIVEPGVTSDWRTITGQARGYIQPIALLDAWQARAMQKDLFARFDSETGLGAYVNCMMFEPKHRPIPHAFEKTKVRAIEELAREWAPVLMAYALKRAKQGIHSLNNKSNLGHPYFAHPGTPAVRVELATEFLNAYVRDGSNVMTKAPYSSPFKATGIRLQTDPPDKERPSMYVKAPGKVISLTQSANDKAVITDSGDVLIPARQRTIVNAPVANVFLTQIVDSSIHDVWIDTPLCHHNMFAERQRFPDRRYVLAFDEKNFDRYVVAWSRASAEAIGGEYADFNRVFHESPYLVMEYDRKASYFIYPNDKGGWVQQFGSGLSDVSRAGKEVNIAIMCQWFRERYKLTHLEALEEVLRADHGAWLHLNYGDDNILFGREPSCVAIFDDLMKHFNKYVETVPEEPPAFLGFRWSELERWFYLPAASYLRKTFLPERGVYTTFRKYPCMGWIERRAVFEKYNDGTNLLGSIFSAESEALTRYGGRSWYDIVSLASAERALMKVGEWVRADLVVTEKEYMMTEREKVSSGRYVELDATLVSKARQRLLRHRNDNSYTSAIAA